MELKATIYVGCLALWSLGDLEVVLGWWDRGFPLSRWYGKLSLVGFVFLWFFVTFHVAMWHIREPRLPSKWTRLLSFYLLLALASWPSVLKNQRTTQSVNKLRANTMQNRCCLEFNYAEHFRCQAFHNVYKVACLFQMP